MLKLAFKLKPVDSFALTFEQYVARITRDDNLTGIGDDIARQFEGQQFYTANSIELRLP